MYQLFLVPILTQLTFGSLAASQTNSAKQELYDSLTTASKTNDDATSVFTQLNNQSVEYQKQLEDIIESLSENTNKTMADIAKFQLRFSQEKQRFVIISFISLLSIFFILFLKIALKIIARKQNKS